MIQTPVAGEMPEKVFFILRVDGESSRFRISWNRDSFERARDSAISFAWKRRIETFFPRTSTLILNENEPLVKSLVLAGDEMRHGRGRREICRKGKRRRTVGTRNSGGEGCRRRTMNTSESFQRLWPRAPIYLIYVVILKMLPLIHIAKLRRAQHNSND